MNILKSLSPILFLSIMLVSCEISIDDYESPLSDKSITQLEYILVEDNTGAEIVLTYTDPDGDGMDYQTSVSAPLKPRTQYTGHIQLTDTTQGHSPALTKEVIIMESDEYQFFYVRDEVLDIRSYEYTDYDVNNKPIGFHTVLNTGKPSRGKLEIMLYHQLDKNGHKVEQGDYTNAKGVIDVHAVFNITIADPKS